MTLKRTPIKPRQESDGTTSGDQTQSERGAESLTRSFSQLSMVSQRSEVHRETLDSFLSVLPNERPGKLLNIIDKRANDLKSKTHIIINDLKSAVTHYEQKKDKNKADVIKTRIEKIRVQYKNVLETLEKWAAEQERLIDEAFNEEDDEQNIDEVQDTNESIDLESSVRRSHSTENEDNQTPANTDSIQERVLKMCIEPDYSVQLPRRTSTLQQSRGVERPRFLSSSIN